MEALYTLYDALVGINVPADKARAVANALERDMLDQLVTKTDLAHARELLSKDIAALELRMDTRLSDLRHSMTLRMGAMISGSVVLTSAIVGTVQVFLSGP